MKTLAVVDKLNITTTRAKDLSKWPHLKDLEIADVDDEQVTVLIGEYVPEAQEHEKRRREGSVEPYAVRTFLSWSVLGPVDAANILCSQAKNVSFVKYGDGRSDQQMKQNLRLEDIDINGSSKKGMSIENRKH